MNYDLFVHSQVQNNHDDAPVLEQMVSKYDLDFIKIEFVFMSDGWRE